MTYQVQLNNKPEKIVKYEIDGDEFYTFEIYYIEENDHENIEFVQGYLVCWSMLGFTDCSENTYFEDYNDALLCALEL